MLIHLWATMSASTPAYDTVKGIAYRGTTGDAYTDSMCRLDVYYPVDKKDFATVVWYHGGGLTGGKRSVPRELREKGVAVVAVDYRLCAKDGDSAVTTDDCVDDAAAAAAWVAQNIASYGGDPSRIYLAGHSAGGYLTMMIGFDKSRLKPYGIDPDMFAALVPYSGQAITHFENRRQRGISNLQPIVDESAPLYHLRPDCPPVLLITGDRELEMLGRYEENAYLWRMLRLAGHPDVQLKELDGFGHSPMVHPGHLLLLDYLHRRGER